MIEVCRDPAFWMGIASHPQVAPHVSRGHEVDWSIVTQPHVLPLRAEHGGFLFSQLDGVGRVCELHTLFTPEGWGREVAAAAKLAFDEVFGRGLQIVTTLEIDGNLRSSPPRSFGWRAAGEFGMVNMLDCRAKSWFLTADAWGLSPAKQRVNRLCRSSQP